MLLFNAVTDALERSPEGDARWLDAAVEAMSSASGWAQSEMRRVLLVVRQDYVTDDLAELTTALRTSLRVGANLVDVAGATHTRMGR